MSRKIVGRTVGTTLNPEKLKTQAGGGSTSGKDGGYYTPSVTQPDENTMRVAFTPSDSSMPEVASRDVTLPAGAGGKSAYQYAQDDGYTGTEAEFAAKMAEEIPSDDHINSLIDTKLGVIENGAY